MADRETTVYELKARVMQLCRDKGWGDNGIQNPQPIPENARAWIYKCHNLWYTIGKCPYGRRRNSHGRPGYDGLRAEIARYAAMP